MATMTFAGSTLWNDASTGIDRLAISTRGSGAEWNLVALPRGDGDIAQDMGQRREEIRVVARYVVTDSELNALLTTANTARAGVGTLAAGGRTYTNCVMLDAEVTREDPVLVAGSAKRFARATFIFRKLR